MHLSSLRELYNEVVLYTCSHKNWKQLQSTWREAEFLTGKWHRQNNASVILYLLHVTIEFILHMFLNECYCWNLKLTIVHRRIIEYHPDKSVFTLYTLKIILFGLIMMALTMAQPPSLAAIIVIMTIICNKMNVKKYAWSCGRAIKYNAVAIPLNNVHNSDHAK